MAVDGAGVAGERAAQRRAATLEELADQLDGRRFVGRGRELTRLDELLEAPHGRVVLLHGPGGIGKSALLREIARHARRWGRPTFLLDCRDAVPLPATLAPALAASDTERPVVLIDTFEHVASLADHLRRDVLSALPSSALVVICSRTPPEPAWRAGAWSSLVDVLALEPLSPREGRALLDAYGVQDPELVDAALTWTGGSPLGLVLAAEHGGPKALLPPESVATELVERLLDEPYARENQHLDALVLASIVRVTTPALLERVLPAVDAAAVWEWLSQRAFMSRAGTGIAPHELVARSLRAVVRAHSPAVERDLRRRAIDVLVAEARAGGPAGVADLTVLVDNPALRWAFGVNGRTHYLDIVRPWDALVLLDQSNPRIAPYVSRIRRWLDVRPCPLFVVRDSTRTAAGVGLVFSTSTATPEAWADPDAGRWLRHAHEHAGGDAVIWLCSETLDDDPAGVVQGLIGIGGYHFTGAANSVASYIPITPDHADSLAFVREANAEYVPELDTVLDDGSPLHTYVIKDGPGGVFERIHRTVYAELGIPFSHPAALPPTGERTVSEERLEQVRSALRSFWRDAELAREPLADQLLPPGGSATARAAGVRRLINEAVERAWHDPDADERLALELAYLLPPGKQADRELHVSRSTRYRLLRKAIEAVAVMLEVDRVA